MSAEIEAEEYRVYSAVLVGKFLGPNRERFVVNEEVTARGLDLQDGRSEVTEWRLKLRGLKEETANDFLEKNKHPALMQPKLETPLPYTILSKEESSRIWDRTEETKRGGALDGWKVYHERYPNSGSKISFSRVGFDAGQTQGLVLFGASAHWLMGRGGMILVEKREGAWIVADEYRSWIS